MSRVSTRLARSTSASSRSYSPPVSATSTPSGLSSRRRAGSSVQPAKRQAARRGSVRRSAGVAGAAQHGADARQQFARVERLGHVVVGAEFQADDAVGLLAHRGQHDDRHVGLGAQPAGEVQPALAGQHQVEHHQVVVAVAKARRASLRVAHRGDAHVGASLPGSARAGRGFRDHRPPPGYAASAP